MSLKSLLRSPMNRQPFRWMIQLSRRLLTTVLKRLPGRREIHDSWAAIAAYVFMAGMLLFLTLKIVPNDIPVYKAYYLWDKAKDFLFLFCLLLFCEPLRRFLFVVLVYALIRFLWQIFITITNEDINDIRWINATWLTLASCMTYLSIKEMLNRKGK